MRSICVWLIAALALAHFESSAQTASGQLLPRVEGVGSANASGVALSQSALTYLAWLQGSNSIIKAHPGMLTSQGSAPADAMTFPTGAIASTIGRRDASNSISAMFPRIFNVQTYGATGNGRTNDSAAILAAWTAMTNAHGGVLYFPSGRYLDTNTYLLQTVDVPAGYTINYNAQFVIRGDSSGSSYWLARVTNTAFLQARLTPLNFQNITIEGSGSSTGYVAIAQTGTQELTDTRFSHFDTGCDVAGAAGGHAYGVSFWACGTGMRVPAYADGWVGQILGHYCYRTVLETGGTVQYYPGIRASSNQRWHIVGNRNRYGAVIGAGGSIAVTCYMEGTTNAIVAIGHPPEFGDPDADDTIRAVALDGIGWQQAFGSGIQVYTRPMCMMVRNSGLLSQQHEVEFMTSAADRTPIAFENCTGARLKKSNGEIVNLYPHGGSWNWTPMTLSPFGFAPGWSDVATPNAAKNARFGALGYTSDAVPQTMFSSSIFSPSTAEMLYGGGTSLGRPYSGHVWYGGNPSISGPGVAWMRLDATGLTANGAGLSNIPPSGVIGLISNLTWLANSGVLTPGSIGNNGGSGTNTQLYGTTKISGAAAVLGDVAVSGVITATGITGTHQGDGTALDLDAGHLISGTVPLARLSGINSNNLDSATRAMLGGGSKGTTGAVTNGDTRALRFTGGLYGTTLHPAGGDFVDVFRDAAEVPIIQWSDLESLWVVPSGIGLAVHGPVSMDHNGGSVSVPITRLGHPTNAMANLVVDMSKSYVSTNLAGNITISSVAWSALQEFESTIIDVYPAGADRIVTFAPSILGTSGAGATVTITNGAYSHALIKVSGVPGLNTNQTVDFFY